MDTADTRTRLVPTAMQLFWEKSYNSTSIADVLQTAKVNISCGPVATDQDALVFPPTSYVENGQTQTCRSRWQRVGGNAFDVTTELQSKESWVPGFKVHMQMLANN